MRISTTYFQRNSLTNGFGKGCIKPCVCVAKGAGILTPFIPVYITGGFAPLQSQDAEPTQINALSTVTGSDIPGLYPALPGDVSH